MLLRKLWTFLYYEEIKYTLDRFDVLSAGLVSELTGWSGCSE